MILSLSFERVERFRWAVFTVLLGDRALGFVSELPEGLWIAYRAGSVVPGQFPDRESAAQCLVQAGNMPVVRTVAVGNKADSQQPATSPAA